MKESIPKWLCGILKEIPVYSLFRGAGLFPHSHRSKSKIPFDLPPLRLLICGGDALPHKVRESFERVFGLKIIEGYDITEASPVVSVNPSPEARVPGSAGPPIEAIHLRIVDEKDQDLPPNQVGEIVISGDPISPGYFSGFNVYPQEVEEVLLEMDRIARVAVVGEKRALRGEMVKAYIVPQEGVTLEPQEVVRFCKKRLPPYKVPRLVEIVTDLPQTVTGKVMKYLITSGGKRWK